MQKTQVTFCKQGDAIPGITVEPSKQRRDDFDAASVPPPTAQKIQDPFRFAASLSAVHQHEKESKHLSFPSGFWAVGNGGHTYAGRKEQPVCLWQSSSPRSSSFTHTLESHMKEKGILWVLWDVGCPSSHGRLTQSTASPGRAARRPPTTATSRSQPALVPPCSSSISRTPQHGKGPSALRKRDKHK